MCHDPPDRRRFIALALELDDNYVIEDAQLLQRLAWTFLIFSQEEAHLLRACDWAKQALKIEDNCEINTLVAAACLRLKEKNFGIRCAKRAIELGKKEGVDTRMPESLLKDLQELEYWIGNMVTGLYGYRAIWLYGYMVILLGWQRAVLLSG